MRAFSPISSALVLSCCLLGGASAQTRTIPEPATLWQGEMHSATPATLQGATVIAKADRLADLVAHDKPVMVDVSHADRKPPGLAATALWSPVHRSLPGATWLPGAGEGTDDPKFTQAFEATFQRLTGGDKDKPIVTFCHPNRWGSWNTAKRLTQLGYRHVYWYPGGAEGWVEGGKTLDETKMPPTLPRFEILANATASAARPTN